MKASKLPKETTVTAVSRTEELTPSGLKASKLLVKLQDGRKCYIVAKPNQTHIPTGFVCGIMDRDIFTVDVVDLEGQMVGELPTVVADIYTMRFVGIEPIGG